MYSQDNGISNGFRGKDPLKGENTEESELAFQVQNSQQNDPTIINKLVTVYSSDLLNWINLLIYFRDRQFSTPEQSINVLKSTYVQAITHLEEFHGRVSVCNWLFGISYEIINKRQLSDRLKDLFRMRKSITESFENLALDEQWYKFSYLPVHVRTVMILRYLFLLDISDIAMILNINPQEAHHRLVLGRERLFTHLSPAHKLSEIHTYLDGMLSGPSDHAHKILQHLQTCDQCKDLIKQLTDQEILLKEDFVNRWDRKLLSFTEQDTLIHEIMDEIQVQKNRPSKKFPLKQVIWIIGLSMLFFGLAEVFVRLTPVEREFPTPQPTNSPVVPTVVELPPEVLPSHNYTSMVMPPQYIIPAFSNDGKWAVFASIQVDPITQLSLQPTIELYNRKANSIKVISENKTEQYLQGVWWDFVPSISADGKLIAYAAISDGNDIGGEPCLTESQQPCLDIFLYDQETGVTKRITQGVGGTAVDGNSLSPMISADGQWVAYWSAASNLVEGTQFICQSDYDFHCLFVYLYNLSSGTIERIPIISWVSGFAEGVDRISLSADGQLIAFTVITYAGNIATLSGDEIKIYLPPGISQSLTIFDASRRDWKYSEAIVYDRKANNYEMENVSPEGIHGNGNSSSPVISADGRFVAFNSTSTNIVSSDGNGFADVFIRDRNSGELTIISHAPDGRWGNGDSGRSGWSGYYYSLNISPDGQSVVYSSLATNLSESQPIHCIPEGLVCNLLYLYNRDTDQSTLINDTPTYDWSYYPEISADGRWISYMEYKSNCSNLQLQCSNVMLYDMQIGWVYDLTKSGKGISQIPWSYLGSLKIPAEIWERNAIAFSPNSNYLASAGNDSKVRIWRFSGGIPRNSEPDITLSVSGKEYYTSVAFSPDSMWLAAGTTTRSVFIWKLPEGRLIYTLEGYSGPIKDLMFNPDGSSLVVSSNQELEIWQIERGQLIKMSSFSYGITSVYGVAISPRGGLVAAARGDGSVWIQSTSNGQVVCRLGGSQVAVSDIVFSLDGSLLATMSMDGKINIWKIDRSGSVNVSITPINTVWTDNLYGPIIFSPDDRFLISSSSVGGLLLWGVSDGNIYTLSSPIQDGRFDSLAFSSLGDQLATTNINGEIAIWGVRPESTSTYFIKSQEDTNDSSTIVSSTTNDLLLSDNLSNYLNEKQISLDQVAEKIGFPLLVPTLLPENIHYSGSMINLDGSIWLEFDASDQGGIQAKLYLYERAIGNEQPPVMIIGASAAIVKIPLITPSGMDISEYVQGDWNLESTDSEQGIMHTNKWNWNTTTPTQRLRWQQQGIFMAMYYKVEFPSKRVQNEPVRGKFLPLDKLLTKQDLVQISAGMMVYGEISRGVTQGKTSAALNNSLNSLFVQENNYFDMIMPSMSSHKVIFMGFK